MDEMDKNYSKQQNIMLNSVLESIPVGILTFDKTGCITSVTENFFRFGVSRYSASEEIIGQNVSEIELFNSISIIDDVNSLHDGYGFEKCLMTQQTLDGGQLTIVVKGTPVYSDNEYEGGALLVEDVKVSVEKIKKSNTDSGDIKDIFSKISDSYLICSPEGKIREIHETMKLGLSEIFDLKKEGDIFDSLPPEISEKLRRYAEADGTSKNQLFSDTFETGGEKIFLTSFFTKAATDNKILVLLFSDVSKMGINSSQANAELDELRKYQLIAGSVIDAIINIDLDGNINFWNESAEKLFGIKRSAVFGKFIGKIIPIFDEKYFVKLKEELLKSKVWESRLKFGSADKMEYLNVKLTLLEESSPSSIVILCTNITKQIKLERRLRQSEEKFRDIVTNTREYICTIDLIGKISYVNPFFIKEFGYSEDEFVGKEFASLIEDGFLKKHGFDLKMFDNSGLQTIELPLLKKNGRIAHVMSNFSIVTDLSDKPKYYNAILTDITSQKETERDLLLIKSVFEASNEGIAVAAERKLVLVNNTFAKMFGYNETDEVVGKDPLDMVDNMDIPLVAKKIEYLESHINEPQRYEYRARRKDEGSFFAENSTISYKAENRLYIVSIIRDVTEEKRAQLALTESEKRYRSITENISESLWTAERHNDKLEVVFYTSGVTQITGYTPLEFMENRRLWIKIVHPNDVSFMLGRIKRLYRDSARDTDEIEYRILNKDGDIVWIENKINVVRNKKGEIEKVFGVVSDVSLSKRAEEELKKSAENLKKLNDTKDKFISIISHDLRTPFSSIIGFTELLQSDPNMEYEKRDQYHRFILESSKSMLSLVNSLLDWTRLQTGRLNFEPKRVNAKNIISKSYQMISGAALNKNIKVLNDVMTDVFIHADEELLLQVFNNLLSNAIKFTDSGGRINVGVYPNIEGRVVQFSVKDDGVGIKENDINKLFKVDSKFTLAGTAGEKGSGLGLSLCYDIVVKHGGNIWVESKYGEGTEFKFTIPISSTRILLVDDIQTDRLLYSKLLKSILPNYTIELANNGKEAFDQIKLMQPALVITDHKMPVMSGYELVEKLNRENMTYKPPVLVLSSDVTEGIKEDYAELGIKYVFKKPVDLAQFKHAIEELLKKAIFS